MANSAEKVQVGAVHHGNLADHSRLNEELDGAINRRSPHRRQFVTERLGSEAGLLLLQQAHYRLPGGRGPVAAAIQYR